jgi:glutamate dehydrogenase (NAD(P)+)
MEKRFEERSARQLLSAIEQATGTTFSDQELAKFARGADEIDLVYSGLEETMIQAYHEIRAIQQRRNENIDLRTASMISAIDKIALAYQELGIFP